VSDVPRAATSGSDHRALRVYVTAVDHGWDIHGELDGQIMITEHRDDWHRVERSCARLEVALRRLGGKPGTVAAPDFATSDLVGRFSREHGRVPWLTVPS
jgi:hypothetical protein